MILILSGVFDEIIASGQMLGLIVACAVGIILLLIFRPKIVRRLENAKPSDVIMVAIWFFGICMGADAVLGFLTHGESWSAMFHQGHETGYLPQFNDYFKTSSYAVQGKYAELWPEYSPAAIMVLKLFGLLIKPDFYEMTTSTYALLLREQVPMMVYLMLVVFCMVSGYYMMNRNIRTNGARIYDSVFAFMLLFSFPVMYCIELGNIIAISFVLTLFFICYRGSEDRWVKVISDACLVIAGALNVAPLIFALMLLEKREYKRIGRIFALGAVLFVIPSFATGFGGMLTYLGDFFGVHAYEPFFGNPSVVSIFNALGVYNPAVLLTVFIVFQLIALAGAVILTEPWKRALCLAYLVMNTPSYRNSVTAIFILIPLAMLIGREKIRPKDMYLGTLMLLICAPLPEVMIKQKITVYEIGEYFGYFMMLGANQILFPLFLQAIFVGLAAMSVAELVRIRRRKNITHNS